MSITKFFVKKAEYLAGDDMGNQVKVEVDYAGGSFQTLEVAMADRGMEQLRAAVDVAVRGMLARKHGVNLSGNLKK